MLTAGNEQVRTYSIGRGDWNAVVLSDDCVSSRHAEFTVSRTGRYYLSDCGSMNGTRLWSGDGWMSFLEGYVAPDQKVAFGETELLVRDILAAIEQSTGAKAGGDSN